MADRSKKCRGFTLAELLVAICLATLVIALAQPAFEGLLSPPSVRAAVAAVMTALEEARCRAILRGGEVYFALVDHTAPRAADRFRRYYVAEADPDHPADPCPISKIFLLPEGSSFFAGPLPSAFDSERLPPIRLPVLGGELAAPHLKFGAAGELERPAPGGAPPRLLLFRGEMRQGRAVFRGRDRRVEVIDISRFTGIATRTHFEMAVP